MDVKPSGNRLTCVICGYATAINIQIVFLQESCGVCRSIQLQSQDPHCDPLEGNKEGRGLWVSTVRIRTIGLNEVFFFFFFFGVLIINF
jgi:hypothetical protein